MATLERTIVDEPDANQMEARFHRVIDALATKLTEAAWHLEAAEDDLLALPHLRWRALAPAVEHEASRSAGERDQAAPASSGSSRVAAPASASWDRSSSARPRSEWSGVGP